MATVKYEVQPLFAEPVFRADISEAITPDQVEYLKGLKMVRNKTNLISENLYIFEEPELARLKQAVSDALAAYARDVMGIDQEIYVTQSWALENPPRTGMHGHSHSNSIVSGSLYYTDMPSPGGKMVFSRHRTYQQIELPPQPERQTLFNAPANIVEPKKGEVVLFSSSLQHFVEPHQADVPRHAVAFNTFVRGKIGSFRDVSELTL
jgi:uncharacterized protein (TIGR02466 family)